MKQVHYTDKYGRNVTKNEGFSWNLFWKLTFMGVVPGIFYLVFKGWFMALRGTYRTVKRIGKNLKDK